MTDKEFKQLQAELSYYMDKVSELQKKYIAETGVEFNNIIPSHFEFKPKSERIVDEIWDELYGQGFKIAGWHLNGALEPLDSWFEDNDWEL